MEEVVVEGAVCEGVGQQGPRFWDYLYSLRQSATLCDIQLCVKAAGGGHDSLSLPAHKLVLAASSRYFSHCLQVNDLLDEYNFDGISVEHLQAVIDYMYRQISWDQLCADSIGKVVAETLQVVYHDEQESPPGDGTVHSLQGTGFVREVQKRQIQRYKRNYIPPAEVQTWIEASREVVPRKSRGRRPASKPVSTRIEETHMSTYTDVLKNIVPMSPGHSKKQLENDEQELALIEDKKPQIEGSDTKSSSICGDRDNAIEDIAPGSERVCDERTNKAVISNKDNTGLDAQVKSEKQNSTVCSKMDSHSDLSIKSSKNYKTDTENKVIDHNDARTDGKSIEASAMISESSAKLSDMVRIESCIDNVDPSPTLKDEKLSERATSHMTRDQPMNIKEREGGRISCKVVTRQLDRGIKVVHTSSGEKVYCIEPTQVATNSGLMMATKMPPTQSGDSWSEDTTDEEEEMVVTPGGIKLERDPTEIKDGEILDYDGKNNRLGMTVESMEVDIKTEKLGKNKVEEAIGNKKKDSAMFHKGKQTPKSPVTKCTRGGRKVEITEEQRPSIAKRGAYKMDDKVKEYLKKVKQMKKQNKRREATVGESGSREAEGVELKGTKREGVGERNDEEGGSMMVTVETDDKEADPDSSVDDAQAFELTSDKSDNHAAEGDGSTDCVLCGQGVESLNSHISEGPCTKTSYTGKGTTRRINAQAYGEDQRPVQNARKAYSCEKCEEVFEKKKPYFEHLKDHHGERPYRCQHGQCRAAFGSYDGLHKHAQSQHTADDSGHVCYICGKVFRLKQQLKSHMTGTHKERADIPCQLCGRMFKQFSGLTRHLKTFHSDERNFPCPVCHRGFKTKDDMNKHKRRHYQPNKRVDECGNRIAKYPVGLDYPCGYCGKIFKNFYHKKAHENIQHEDKQTGVSYLCTLCNKSFSTRHYLTMHVNNTHRPKHIQCQACLRRFSFKYEIKRHLPKCKGYPVGPKPFECKFCGCSFTMKGNLTKHTQRGKCSGRPPRGVEVVPTSNTDFVVVIHQENESSVQIPISQLTELGIESDMKNVGPLELVSEVTSESLVQSPFVIKSDIPSSIEQDGANSIVVYSTETTGNLNPHHDDKDDLPRDNHMEIPPAEEAPCVLVSDPQAIGQNTMIYSKEDETLGTYDQTVVNSDITNEGSMPTTSASSDIHPQTAEHTNNMYPTEGEI